MQPASVVENLIKKSRGQEREGGSISVKILGFKKNYI